MAYNLYKIKENTAECPLLTSKRRNKKHFALSIHALVVLFYLSTYSNDIGIHPTQVVALIIIIRPLVLSLIILWVMLYALSLRK